MKIGNKNISFMIYKLRFINKPKRQQVDIYRPKLPTIVSANDIIISNMISPNNQHPEEVCQFPLVCCCR